MSIFTRLFQKRSRTFIIRESRLYVNGREATPEEAAEALAIVDGLQELCEIVRRAAKRE